MKNLSEKGLLVNLKIGYWSGKKNDKQISMDVEAQHNTKDAGKYKKNLISDAELKVVQSKAAELRKYVYEHTMPWGDNGDRLLPAKHYMVFCSEFRALQFSFQDAVSNFLFHYPTLVTEAQTKLKTMFRAADYPTADKMKAKFRLELSCDAIAQLDDFRLQVDETELETLREKMQEDYSKRIADATKDIWERIRATVGHMVEKLSEKKPKFHDTLVTNINDLVTLLPQLNITDDPDITQAVASMKSLVVDPANLRQNGAFRSQKVKEAQAILAKFDSYMN